MRAFKICLTLCALEILMLLSMYTSSVMPLVFGREIAVIAHPIDPRDLLRGNYVSLSFERLDVFIDDDYINPGTKIYAVLEPDSKAGENGYKFSFITTQKPSSGLFLSGEMEASSQARFGIEAFFVPVKKAKEIERELANGGILVTLGVSEGGKARIKSVKALDKSVNSTSKSNLRRRSNDRGLAEAGGLLAKFSNIVAMQSKDKTYTKTLNYSFKALAMRIEGDFKPI